MAVCVWNVFLRTAYWRLSPLLKLWLERDRTLRRQTPEEGNYVTAGALEGYVGLGTLLVFPFWPWASRWGTSPAIHSHRVTLLYHRYKSYWADRSLTETCKSMSSNELFSFFSLFYTDFHYAVHASLSNSPASASWVLRLQAWVKMPGN